MSVAQNYKNHVRFDPRFHFFAMPVLLLNFIVAIVVAVRFWSVLHWLGLWLAVVAAALVMVAASAREYGIRNQDRIIRLEERLRYPEVLSPAEVDLAMGLSVRQVIALRFASEAELPGLVSRAAAESLSPKQIKASIKVWRPDTSRI